MMPAAPIAPLEIEGVDPDHLNRLVQWAQPVQQNHIAQREARQDAARVAAQQETTLNRGAVVVSILMVLAGTVATVLSLTGFGAPDRGRALRGSSARLRNDVADLLRSARPSSRCWAGATATSFDGKIGDQQGHLEAIAAADLQAADAVETQAGQVAQSRQNLEIILAALGVSITVAVVMQGLWKEALAAASPAAPAYEAALIAFGLVVICGVIIAAVTELMAMDDAAEDTKTTLDNVICAYKTVTDSVTAVMPTHRPPAVAVSATAASPVARADGRLRQVPLVPRINEVAEAV